MTDAVLRLSDDLALADLRTFLTRAASVNRDGSVRIMAAERTLAMTVGIMDAPMVTGMRVSLLAEPAQLDVVVPLAALLDRLARPDRQTLPVPPQQVQAPWAGISAPRQGWSRVGEVAVTDLAQVAAGGIDAVAEGAGGSAGAHAVADLRHRVWSLPMLHGTRAPSGMAFAAQTLGFLDSTRDSTAVLFGTGRWLRLSTQLGHVLHRGTMLS